MPETPDLTSWLLIHQAMRQTSDRLAVALADLDEGDRDRARALARWFRGFDGELHHHHSVEDDIVFPALAARVPSYQPDCGDEIEADHQRLDELLCELRSSLAAMADRGEWGLPLGRARAASSELAELLQRHLELEDRDVLPVVQRHFTKAEFDAMHEQASKSLSLGQARFTVPWIMCEIDADQRARLWAEAPLVLRLVHRASRRGYARLAAAALGQPLAVG